MTSYTECPRQMSFLIAMNFLSSSYLRRTTFTYLDSIVDSFFSSNIACSSSVNSWGDQLRNPYVAEPSSFSSWIFSVIFHLDPYHHWKRHQHDYFLSLLIVVFLTMPAFPLQAGIVNFPQISYNGNLIFPLVPILL